jgi:hypothetical protein
MLKTKPADAAVGDCPEFSVVGREAFRRHAGHVWRWVGGVMFLAFAVSLASFSSYLRVAGEIPTWSPSGTELPTPNGYDDFLAAGAQISNPVQSRVLRGTRTPAEWRALLAAHRSALARLRRGLPRDCRVPFDPTVRGLFELNQFRTLTRLLIAEGDLAAADGRLSDAMNSYLDVIRFGTAMPRGGGIVYSYRGLSFQEEGLRGLDRIRSQLTEGNRDRLASELELLDRRCMRAPEAIERQAEWGTAVLIGILRQPDPLQEARRLMSDTPTSVPPLTDWRESWELRLTSRTRIVENYRGYMAQVSQDLEQPFYRRPKPRPLPTDPINRLFMRGHKDYTLLAAWEPRDFNWRMLTTQLALERYRSRRGSLPASLKELTPEYLAEVPQDPYAPHPLVYQRQGSRYRLYSRGPDGDDDSGRDLSGFPERDNDGDLVSLRGR